MGGAAMEQDYRWSLPRHRNREAPPGETDDLTGDTVGSVDQGEKVIGSREAKQFATGIF